MSRVKKKFDFRGVVFHKSKIFEQDLYFNSDDESEDEESTSEKSSKIEKSPASEELYNVPFLDYKMLFLTIFLNDLQYFGISKNKIRDFFFDCISTVQIYGEGDDHISVECIIDFIKKNLALQ